LKRRDKLTKSTVSKLFVVHFPLQATRSEYRCDIYIIFCCLFHDVVNRAGYVTLKKTCQDVYERYTFSNVRVNILTCFMISSWNLYGWTEKNHGKPS